MSRRILCVDDEENVLIGLQRSLRKQFQVEVAVGGPAGLRKLETEGPFAVVVADMQMPEMNGVEFLGQVETRWPDTVRLMLTGNADQKTAVDAVNRGHVFQFLTKPCPPDQLTATLAVAIGRYECIRAERDLLENTLTGAIRAISEILGALKPRTRMAPTPRPEHIKQICQTLQISNVWEVEVASLLANVGYATLPPAVLLKLSVDMTLSEAETRLLLNIPESGAELVSRIPRLENVSRIIRYSQKHFDGGGIPNDACAGAEIPVGARILRVLQELGREGYNGLPIAEIVGHLRNKRGIYDPAVLDAALTLPAWPANSIVTLQSPAEPVVATTLPVKSEPEGVSAPMASSRTKRRRDTEPVAIVILDDKPVVLEKLRVGLEGTSWTVHPAATPVEAIEICRREAIDVVVANLALLGDDVLLLKRSLQAQVKQRITPVFGLAAKGSAPDRLRMHELGLAAVVTKPVDSQEFRRRVSQVLNLDTTYKYFQFDPRALVVTIPSHLPPTLADAIFVTLAARFEEALDEGLDSCVLDLSKVTSVDRTVIDLLLLFNQTSRKFDFRSGIVSSPAFNAIASEFEETRCLELNDSLDEAFARIGQSAEAA